MNRHILSGFHIPDKTTCIEEYNYEILLYNKNYKLNKLQIKVEFIKVHKKNILNKVLRSLNIKTGQKNNDKMF